MLIADMIWKQLSHTNSLIMITRWLYLWILKSINLFKQSQVFRHSVHPPLFCWGRGWTSYQLFKKGGLDRTSVFRGGWHFSGGCNFSTKNKLKSEILMTKKLTNKNSLLCGNLELNWEILTKNLVTFKR